MPTLHRRAPKRAANLAAALIAPDTLSQPAWAWFVAYARKVRASRQRLLLSSENFASLKPLPHKSQLLASTLRALGFGKLRVVIIYRRLYEKLQSEHSEQYLADYRARVNVSEYEPIVDWIEARNPFAEVKFHQTTALRRHFERVGAEVSVLNLHALPPNAASSDLVVEFICEHLRAAHTCAQLRSHPHAAKVLRKNERPRGSALLVDIIYGAAAARGLRRIVSSRALHALQALGADTRGDLVVQRRCLSAREAERIWNATLTEESDVLGRRLTAAELAALRGDFAAKSAGLCSANVSAVLASPAWAKPLAIALKRGTELLAR